MDNIETAYELIFGSQPEKPTLENLPHRMARNCLSTAIESLELFRNGEDLNNTQKKVIHLALDFGISTAFLGFPLETRTALRGIHNRFHKRYVKEIHCLKNDLGL